LRTGAGGLDAGTMTVWQELAQADGASLDAALDKVLAQGRALIASIEGGDAAERVRSIDRMSADELRSVAYAAGAPHPSAS
jgi:hypothetical protein